MATLNPTDWASQAALNALLRYKPQQEGLADLQRQAEERFGGEVAAGKSEGRLGAQAAQGAIAPTQAIFNQAGGEDARARALLAGVLSSLPAGSPFATAAANEQAAGSERLSNSRAHALGDLQQRKVAAASLPAYTRLAAQATLAKALQAIEGKQQALRGAQGTDVAAEIAKMRGEAAKEQTSERNDQLNRQTQREDARLGAKTSRENARESNQTKRETAGSKAASKPASHKEQEQAASTIGEIKGLLGRQAYANGSRAQRVAALSAGVPEQSTEVNGQKVKTPAIKAYAPNLMMSAALDWSEIGHLSAHTQHELEAHGYDVAGLGVPLYKAPTASGVLSNGRQPNPHGGQAHHF